MNLGNARRSYQAAEPKEREAILGAFVQGIKVSERGYGGERADETKAYTFGDPFHLHLERTLMNSVSRNGSGTPIRLA